MGHKLWAGSHLMRCLLWGCAALALRGLARGPRTGTREAWRAVKLACAGARAAARLQGRARANRLVALCRESGVGRERLCENPEAAFILAEELNGQQRFGELIALVTPHLRDDPPYAKLYGIRGLGHLGLGQYAEAIADLNKCTQLRPAAARDFNYKLYHAYLYGLRGNAEAAREAMAVQMLGTGFTGDPGAALASFLAAKLAPHLAPLALKGTVGVVIGCFQTAVGHAILDPFHFIQLFRHRFDNLILVHPPYSQYSPATRLSAHILDPYIEQVEVSDPDVLNFSWQSLGELRHENVTFLVHTYWTLNRLAFQARSAPDHPMARGRDYLTLPPKLVGRAEAVLRRNHFQPDRPVVVVHTREHGYHGLRGQYYRNTDVRNYVPALRRLVDLGFQVVRIGDQKMTRVAREVPGMVELPTTDYYDFVLDPYFISRCAFMISCQSGPCSYARVFGKPNLVVNAVYHYTLLPERNELLAFKHYKAAGTGKALSLDEIFQAGAHLFDRTEHFERAGIDVQDMTPEEILAATEEMVEWLDAPDRAETAAQKQFRARMQYFAAHPDRANPHSHPLTDYIGYALPECRVSDAVCRLRPGFLAPEEGEAAPAGRADFPLRAA